MVSGTVDQIERRAAEARPALAENDDHILNRLGRGGFKKLYVGIHGDEESAGNRQIVARAQGLALLRTARYPLEVAFYDSATARV